MYINLSDKKIRVISESHDKNLFSLRMESGDSVEEIYNAFDTADLSEIKLYSDDNELLGVYTGYAIIETFYYIPATKQSVINLMKYKIEDIRDGLNDCMEKIDAIQNGEAASQGAYALSIVAGSFSDDQAAKCVLLFEEWKPGMAYEAGDRKRYQSNLYKCKQAHTSEAQHTPNLVPALWDLISADETQGTIDHPIPIPDPFSSMEYVKGKYYLEAGVLYRMNREGMEDGEKISLAYKPSQLVGQYFEIVDSEG